MEKILVKGVEVQFNDLTEEMQEKLYLERKAEFEKEAAKSQYAEIRRLIINEDEIDLVVLDEAFNVETKIYGNEENQNLNLIWKHPKFEKNDDKRKILAESDNWSFRMLPAEDEGSSSEFLNQMLRDEIQNDCDRVVVDAIINNPNFKMEEETRKMLAKSDNRNHRIIAVKDEGSSEEFLENMFWKETDEDVLEAIEVKLLSKISKKSVTLNVVQKRNILKVLRSVKKDKKKQPLAEYVKEIVDIIG